MSLPRDYESWSFNDRSFLFAILASLLWHLFWFFSVNVVVTPQSIKKSAQTKVVSLGAVLDDDIFRTLVESRVETTKAFYREISDLDSATQIPAQTITRHESGEVNSLPEGVKFGRSLKDLIGGTKVSPMAASESFGMDVSGDRFEIAGDFKKQDVLSHPELPPLPLAVIAIEIELDGSGSVASSRIIQSSGDPEADNRFEDNLRQWIFSPNAALRSETKAKATVIFHAAA